MDRKSSIKDVHKSIPQDLPELYKELCVKLGDDNPFARFSIGFGHYVWSDNRYQWKKITDANDLEKQLVQDELSKTITRISSRIGSKTAAALFTTPDDSYIYYNDDNGSIKILITGWGFKKPERRISGGDVNEIKKKNPVNLSFSYDGVRQPNYDFIIKLERQEKSLKTDSDGFYKFSNLKVGEHFIIKDVKSEKEFTFNVIEGQSEYDYDITTYVNVIITVSSETEPIPGEQIKLVYKGKEFTSYTNSNGSGVIQVPFYEGEDVIATVRDKIQQEKVITNEILFYFDFEREKEQDVITDIIVSVLKNGQPLQSIDVLIRYANQVYQGLTDINGNYLQKVSICKGEPCSVELKDFENQVKELEEQDINKFIFQKIENDEEYQPDDKFRFKPRIIVKREDGDIVRNYSIEVEYDGSSAQYTSNMDGYVYLNEMNEGERLIVSSWPNKEIIKEYYLDHNQEELEFIIPNQGKQEDKSRKIKVMFRDIKGNPIICENVVFQQKGKNNITHKLDEYGNTSFYDDEFKIAVPIYVTINGWNNEETYDSFPFTLCEGEYEYLIQERPSKTSKWNRIIEIITILISAICFLLLWPFFEAFCLEMFNAIYN